MTDMKHYKVFVQNSKNGPLEHDYDIKVTNIITIAQSTGEQWSSTGRGEVVGALEDDGNRVIVRLSDKKKPIKLDYKQAAELQMLLLANLEKDYVTEFREEETVLQFAGLAD
jgi:hypothetical protein